MFLVRNLAFNMLIAVAVSLSQLASAQSISISNFHSVRDGEVYRSGKPVPEQIAELTSLGIKTIVSLETYMLDPDDADEEAVAAAAAGINFLRVPMSPLPFDPPTVEQIQSAVDLIADPDNQPALVHCYHGSDRTGLVVGAYHIVHEGWTADDAIADMRNYGHGWLFYGWDDLLYNFER